MQRRSDIFKQLVVLAVIFSFTNSMIFGQKKTAQTKPAVKKCSGAWVGVVKYSRKQTASEAKTTPRISGAAGGEDSKVSEMRYEYKGRALVTEAAEKDGSTKVKAVISSKMTSEEKTSSKEKVSCDRGKTWRTQTGNFATATKVEGNDGNAEANVTVGVNDDGTYNVSVAFPPIRGQQEGSFSSNFSGQCTNKKGVDEKSPPSETSISGNSLISDGSHRIDPKNTNRLSGSFTQAGIAGMEETMSWSLQKCGAPLMITDVELYQPIHPSYNNWIKIQNYTIDGNFVKVVAKIANLSGDTKQTTLEVRELKENALLPEGKMPISVDANEEKEIVYMWDTSGYAWKESGELNQPEINRQIQVKITEDSRTENLEIRPKPVIVIPGMWTDKFSFSQFLSYFENMKSAHWAVDYARVLPNKSAAENAPEVEKRIKEMQERTNAWHVDLVGHSTGGLAGRVYINDLMGQLADGKPTVTNFVMVGTPNRGTPCSVGVDNIISRFFNRSGEAFREITYKNMQEFNRRYTATKGTKFYGLVGHGYNKTCHLTTPGDGLVPAGSATWQSKDFLKNIKYTPANSTHEFILGETPNMKIIHQWLAIGPKGNHNPDVETMTGSLTDETFDDFSPNRRNYGASFKPASFETPIQIRDDFESPEPSFATGVKLQPNQTTEIEIPVTDGNRLAINLMMPNKVSATLFSQNRTIVSQSLTGTPEAKQAFRLLETDKPFQKGVWKLELESRETEESEIAVVVFIFK